MALKLHSSHVLGWWLLFAISGRVCAEESSESGLIGIESLQPQQKATVEQANSADWPDVIAAYVVDRAKKQVAMSMIESMKKKLVQYPLLTELFPETSRAVEQAGANWISDEGADKIRRRLVRDFTSVPLRIARARLGIGTGEITTLKEELQYRMPSYNFMAALYYTLLKAQAGEMGEKWDSTKLKSSADDYLTGIKFLGLKKLNELGKTVADFEAEKLKKIQEKQDSDIQEINSQIAKINNYRRQILQTVQLNAIYLTILSDIFNEFDRRNGAAVDQIRGTFKEIATQRLPNYRMQIETLRNACLKILEGNSFVHYEKMTKLPSIPGIRDINLVTLVQIENSVHDNLIELSQVAEMCLDLHESLICRQYDTAALNALEILRKTNVITDKRWGRWMAMVGSYTAADTPEKKYALLDHVTDPIGDYLNKRNTVRGEWYIGLNAYLGARVAHETVKPEGPGDTIVALAAPVGLETGFGTGGEFFPFLGVLIAPIDVGTPAMTRLHSANVNGEEIEDTGTTWQQIATPGAYFTCAITRQFPISIGIGTQYNPRLSVDGAAGYSSWQWGGFLAIDVPLMRLR